MNDQVEGLKRQHEMHESGAEPAGDMFDYSSYFPAALPLRSPYLEPEVDKDPEQAHIPQDFSLVRAASNLAHCLRCLRR